MVLLAAAALALALNPVLDDTIRVPPAEWRAVHLVLRQKPAAIRCAFSVRDGRSGVRAILLSKLEWDRLNAGRGYSELASTSYRKSGSLRSGPVPPGDYVLVLDNQLEGRQAAEVRFAVSFDFRERTQPPARTLPTRRKAGVVLITLLGFGWLLGFAARRLRAPVRSRWGL